jgi:hypothetical protein
MAFGFALQMGMKPLRHNSLRACGAPFKHDAANQMTMRRTCGAAVSYPSESPSPKSRAGGRPGAVLVAVARHSMSERPSHHGQSDSFHVTARFYAEPGTFAVGRQMPDCCNALTQEVQGVNKDCVTTGRCGFVQRVPAELEKVTSSVFGEEAPRVCEIDRHSHFTKVPHLTARALLPGTQISDALRT